MRSNKYTCVGCRVRLHTHMHTYIHTYIHTRTLVLVCSWLKLSRPCVVYMLKEIDILEDLHEIKKVCVFVSLFLCMKSLHSHVTGYSGNWSSVETSSILLNWTSFSISSSSLTQSYSCTHTLQPVVTPAPKPIATHVHKTNYLQSVTL